MIDPLYVRGCGWYGPYAQLEHFPLGPQSEPEKPDLGLLDRTLRRGLSDVTRLFMHVARLALAAAGESAADVHIVFGSAFGEIATAEALLQQAFDENTSSPARFRHSVHNAAPGLLSISAHNRLPCNAIAAGWDTVAMALVESSAQLACGAEKVLLVLADERVPASLSSEHRHGPLGAAFLLARTASSGARGILTHLRRATAAELAAGPDPFCGENHPLGSALLLARLLQERGQGCVRLSDASDPWCVDVDAREQP